MQFSLHTGIFVTYMSSISWLLFNVNTYFLFDRIPVDTGRAEWQTADVPVGDDALCDLTDEDEEQDEGQQPAEVVTGEVEPGAVMDVDLRALAAPASNRKWKESELQHCNTHRQKVKQVQDEADKTGFFFSFDDWPADSF